MNPSFGSSFFSSRMIIAVSITAVSVSLSLSGCNLYLSHNENMKENPYNNNKSHTLDTRVLILLAEIQNSS